MLPLPPAAGFPHPVHLVHPSEPKFDPDVHLNLSMPDYVVTFPHMEKVKHAPPVTSNKGSDFSYSGPFQLLSEEGLRVVRSIVQREEHRFLICLVHHHSYCLLLERLPQPVVQSEPCVGSTTVHPLSGTFRTVLSYWRCSRSL